MSTRENNPNKLFLSNFLLGAAPVFLLFVAGIVLMAVGLFAGQAGAGTSPMQWVVSFIGLDNVHVWWYISRAAGLMGYLLAWLSTLWGFAISSKMLDPFLDRAYTYDFHEHLSLLNLGFVALHVIVLMWDHVQPMSLMEVLLPFVSSYRPFWTGVGIIAFYLSIIVTVTFYIRSWISMKTFRSIHYLSIAAYLGGLFHGLYAGTDSSLIWTQIMYWGTLLSTVFFGVYWLVILRTRNSETNKQVQAVRS